MSEGFEAVDVLFTPAEFERLPAEDLRGQVCVVFDVLRATSSMVAALAEGAEAILPVATIEEAVAWRRREPDVLLAGERNGRRITAGQSGGVEFDLGNSPREFSADRVAGRRLVMTTTNGTRALRACAGADRVLAAAFLNLGATAEAIRALGGRRLLLVCGGTYEEAAFEDTLAAGALVDAVEGAGVARRLTDAARMARELYRSRAAALEAALGEGRNGRRLLGIPDLREDVTFCARRDALPLVAEVLAGWVRRAV
ncbi:MAG: 2-phosphosulfolactate phosphatase [Verrucomicrobia bacterium]|nr:MAG: 2-phosphosulfolactate phosphatase [Verrucomicrobiota bacterium]